ncbi:MULTISPECIES: NAD(P)/FAD-dependent oxidoreductase [Prauserella salsuginis group]|uniref:NAD(P)/FAD-dependent oxidoreductase n=1 Tax=Prauserella salsuginis TaxID=387889 RepID=A0ABW6GAQ4_9PSEU|nr:MULTISPECIES: NAD(P)/FAD-dependent oxidoreductase [Prauserella salsuginis group]MCR3720656.1 Thioredoxin reductase [Prauserella flava]MCR3735263.1 Thioredoxin reductase [Prauserella salsuginis]
MTEQWEGDYDVAVIGGGAAGLNAALMLARARRSVVVLDAGEPRNAPADAVHGLLGREGVPPAELLERGRAEVRGYGGRVVTAEVEAVSAGDDGRFIVSTSGGRSVRARRVLVTTGLVDELPDIAGLRERWGRDVVHCPYCHGWEVRDRAIGVIANGPMALHQASLFRQWSADVVFFSRGMELTGDQREQLLARDIRIVAGEVDALVIDDDRITGIRTAGGETVPRDVVAVGTRMTARAGLLAGLGLRPREHPSGAGDHLPVDVRGETEVAGVWAAGNVTDPSAQVGNAAAAGAFAAAQLNGDLVGEDTRLAVARYRDAAVAATG